MSVDAKSPVAGFEVRAQIRILVVGPVWLERYIVGDLAKAEEGAPVLRPRERFERPSGAANVALGVAALGCQAFLCGFWGLDAEQETLAYLLAAGLVDTTGVVSATQGTGSRTGFFARARPLLWLEMQGATQVATEDSTRLEARAVELVAKVHAVVLAGEAGATEVLSAELCGAIVRAARTAGVPVVARSVAGDMGRFSGAAVVLTDRAGLAQATGVGEAESMAAARALLIEHEVQNLVVMGAGLTVVGPEEAVAFPAATGIGDETGAADAVLAVLAVALAEGEAPAAAAGWAWAAAEDVSLRFGRAALTRNDGLKL